MDAFSILIVVGAIVAFLLLVGLVLGRLYRRATREVSPVKTGAGGKKVIMDGGTIVIPLLHEVSPVNMKTLRPEVQCSGEAALITKDRMRVDVGVEFYVSVLATDEGIARAAQTLGDRTFHVDQLREMIEGKLVASLRAAQEAQIAAEREASAREQERARIAREEAIRAAEIERERKLREAEIAKERELAVAEQERQIIIARKSEEESHARASADLARAEATKAMEAVVTAREVAEAERARQIARIEAQREAEREATRIRLAAQAEKDAAADRAAALREEAQAEADSVTIRTEAKKSDMLAEAERRRAITEAENALSPQIVAMKVDLARLEAFPGIMAQMVKPVEKIESIKIHQVGGLGQGHGGMPGGGEGGADRPVVNQALDSIMGMAVQMPALRKLGAELGLSMEDGLAGMASGALDPAGSPSRPQAPGTGEKSNPAADHG